MDKTSKTNWWGYPRSWSKRVGEGIQLVLNENAVRFDTNKSTLTATAKENLDKLVPVLQNIPYWYYYFGYTDITGPADYNLKLSKERATSVRNYLVSKGAVC
jgi:outer membrane protein OmpA-like peptidoglycan-associated protein